MFIFRTVLDKQYRTHCCIANQYDIRGEFSFHFLFQPSSAKNVNTGNHRFNSISSSFAATFFMMLDNLQYDNILLNYKGSPGNGLVLYVLYIAYCFMMPIIFLNLLVSSFVTVLPLSSFQVLPCSGLSILSTLLCLFPRWLALNQRALDQRGIVRCFRTRLRAHVISTQDNILHILYSGFLSVPRPITSFSPALQCFGATTHADCHQAKRGKKLYSSSLSFSDLKPSVIFSLMSDWFSCRRYRYYSQDCCVGEIHESGINLSFV